MERTPKGTSLILFVAFAQTFAYFSPAATWSPVSRLAATHAIVETHGLSIGDYAAATGDRAMREGRWYSDKAPLPAIAATPAYAGMRAFHRWLGRPAPAFVAHDERGIVARRLEVSHEFEQLLYVCSVSTSGLAGAILGILILRLLSRRFDPPIALASTAAVMLGTPLFAYSTSFYGHVPAAAALTFALELLDHDERSARTWIGVGVMLGISVGCEYLCALPAAVIGLGAIRPARDGIVRTLLLLGLGALLPLGIVAYVHTVCFGGPLRTGYSFLVHPTFVAGHKRGFLGLALPSPEASFGLLFGERRGLFLISPVMLPAALGLVAMMWRRAGDRIVGVAALALFVLFLANASYYMWWGGAATGPRHLVPMMPAFAFGLGYALQNRRARPLVMALAAASAVAMLAITAVGIEAPEHGNMLFDYALPSLRDGHVARLRGASNLGLRLGLPNVASLAPLLVFQILVARRLVRMLGEEGPGGTGSTDPNQRPEYGASSAASTGGVVPPVLLLEHAT